MEQHLFLIHFYLPRLPAPPPLLEPPPPRPIPPPLLLLLPPPKDERELPDLLPDDEVREVRAGRDDRDATDGLGGLGGLDVGMNIGRVLFRDLRKLLFLLPKKMEVMMSSTNTTRKTIRAILIIRAKSLAADV